jgi:hypothetical protein
VISTVDGARATRFASASSRRITGLDAPIVDESAS